MMRAMQKAAAGLKRRIYMLVGRAVLEAVRDDKNRQFVQIKALAGEVKADVERVQQYGFTSHPLPGAQVIFVSLYGNRDHPVVLSADDPRYRHKDMQPGEVAIYTDEGDFLQIKRGGEILIKAANKVRMETPLLEVTGDIVDRCDTDGRSMQGMRDIYNEHIHTGDNGGNTSDPHQEM